VTSSGGIYQQKDREVPDTFFMNVDYVNRGGRGALRADVPSAITTGPTFP
jgi:hypothetical protein